ncbi:MAG: formyl transferase [Sulfurospirillum sp.]|nr:MAG: formyl transferase [Sulfurospirillum sp.]
MQKRPVIVMLVDQSDLSRLMYHGLQKRYEIARVIVEEPVSKKVLLQRRLKRLGYRKVVGQLLFMVFSKMMRPFSQKRIDAIRKRYEVEDVPYPSEKVAEVPSVNAPITIDLLKKLKPDVVVVNGTRIISEEVLGAIDAPFINTHTGITPKYRGVHGGYWALTQSDAENCGVTVHLVDKGIDTGAILYQAKIDVSRKDNFNTYPYLQVLEAVPLMVRAIEDALDGKLETIVRNDLESKIWSHPTMGEYLKYYIRMGVK